MKLVVLDTNVFVSALIQANGKPAAIVARVDEYVLIISLAIENELKEVTSRKRIRRKYPQVTDEFVRLFIEQLREVASYVDVQPEEVKQVVLNDPPDDWILATAKKVQADFIVSGNKHLLDLIEYDHTKIVSPAKFLEFLNSLQ